MPFERRAECPSELSVDGTWTVVQARGVEDERSVDDVGLLRWISMEENVSPAVG